MERLDVTSWAPTVRALGGDDLVILIGHPLYDVTEEGMLKMLQVLVDEGQATLEDGYIRVDDSVLKRALEVVLEETPSDMAEEDAAFTLLIAGAYIEAARMSLRLKDLTAEERQILEPAMLSRLTRETKRLAFTEASDLLREDEPLEHIIRLLVWWHRNQGVYPAWFVEGAAPLLGKYLSPMRLTSTPPRVPARRLHRRRRP